MIKKKKKGQESYTDTLKSVPKAFPALIRAQKVQKRAGKANFDWEDVNEPLFKIGEELAELKKAIENGDNANIGEELGDLLFATVNVSRFLKLDAEETLNRATDKFIARFEQIEKLANERNIDMKTSSLDELDALWDEVKNKGF